MLQQLHIQNYAIIDSIDICFSGHLNIITGETGAGKSILMGALSLVLGERADTSVLLDKSKKCVVEATFDNLNVDAKTYLKKLELDDDDDILIRREIAASGKSRAFINDTPVTLTQLKHLSSLLVDLHQQFDTLELNSNDFQREVVDALANNKTLLEPYSQAYKDFKDTEKVLRRLRDEQALANREFDYHKFLFDELENANFSANEIEETETALKTMSHAENIKSVLSEIYFLLEESDTPALTQLKTVEQKINGLQKYFPEAQSLSDRLHAVVIELKDIAGEVEAVNTRVNYDAEAINELNDRMATAYTLLKKHGVQTTADLLEIKEGLNKQLQKVTDLTEAIARAESDAKGYREQAMSWATKLSAARKKVLEPFIKKVNEMLVQVGMPNARLKVKMEQAAEMNAFGHDEVEFLFNANKSTHFEPIRKVASGGELSRLMLIIKSLVAQSVQLPTLIFDEIDSGISGEAARQVALIIRQLSASHQLIAITHQPQIAARAHTHFFVYKDIQDDKIVTSIKVLSEDERITAIATMLSGKRPTAAAFENAREMMAN